MLQFLRFLFFGKRCDHKWKVEQSMKPFSNKQQFLYSCAECGRMKKVSLNLKVPYFGN